MNEFMNSSSRKSAATKYIFKATLFCIVFTGIFIVFSFLKGFLPADLERLSHGIIGTAAAFLTTYLFLKSDKKTFADIGLKSESKTIVRFVSGIVIGILIMGLLIAGVFYFSDVEINVNPESTLLSFLLMSAPLIPLAFMEELGFRAYPLEILKNTVGIRTAIIITSVLFALYHIVNGWSVTTSFSGPAIWGLIFGLAAVYSKGIALPTGIHYAANLTSSAFSDTKNKSSIWIVEQSGKLTAKEPGSIDLTLIIPGLILFIFAVLCMEIYIRSRMVKEGVNSYAK
ncbi:MAG TPA: type II CAAX endopeptidase family protein [Chitinophagaceae bacterium]